MVISEKCEISYRPVGMPATPPVTQAAHAEHCTVENGNLNNINLSLAINIVPAGDNGKEPNAIIAALFSNLSVIKDILSGELADAPGKMFKFSKGVSAPPELRNVRLCGNHVLETVESPESGEEDNEGEIEERTQEKKYTVLQYTRQALPELLSLLDSICEYSVPLRAPQLARRAEALLERLRQRYEGSKKRKYDAIDAAQLSRDKNSDYHKLVPAELKAVIARMASGLRESLDGLATVEQR